VWQDPALARASQVALGKILSVLPVAARVAAESMAVYAPLIGLEPAVKATLRRLRYSDAQGQASERSVRPLGCFD